MVTKNMTNMTKMTRLYNGWKVPTELYEEIYRNTKAGVDGMLPNQKYTVKQLATPGFWDVLFTKANKCMAGRCFIDMVGKKFFRQRLKCVRNGRLKTNFFVIM